MMAIFNGLYQKESTATRRKTRKPDSKFNRYGDNLGF
jgi:hypothetical protein